MDTNTIEVPKLYRGVILKAHSGKASPRSAIHARCLECTGFLRVDVKNCTAKATCALWPYRPYQQGDGEPVE